MRRQPSSVRSFRVLLPLLLLSWQVGANPILASSALKQSQRSLDTVLPRDTVPSTVYRGDTRSPEDIKAAGGFLPNSDMPPSDPRAYSLFNHAFEGSSVTGTIYISTSTNFCVAGQFAKGSWVYHIHTSPNILDTNGSLGDHVMAEELEYTAVAGIPWSQVIGYVALSGSYNPPPPCKAAGADQSEFESLSGNYTRNEEYDSKRFDSLTASGPQPQLAGFGLVKGSEGLEAEEPWRSFAEKPVKDHAIEFMNNNGAAVGWHGQGFAPLFKAR